MFKRIKKGSRKPTSYTFSVVKVFPPSDRLGIHILRLMAVHNDIARIRDWMKITPRAYADSLTKERHGNLVGMQLRLVLSFVWEAIKIVDEIKSHGEFPEIEKLLDQQTKHALRELEQAKSKLNKLALRFLEVVRNKITFHYDPNKFVKSIKFGKTRLGNKWTSTYIVEGRLPFGTAYFELADTLRVLTFFDAFEGIDDWKLTTIVGPIERAISTFLIGLFEAYLLNRGLLDEIEPRLSPVSEQIRVLFGLHS